MGTESIYGITYGFECTKCNQPISLSFEASKYPVECLNFVLNNSSFAKGFVENEAFSKWDIPLSITKKS